MFACICPYCKQETGIGTAALFDKVLNEPQDLRTVRAGFSDSEGRTNAA